ncbi:YdjY domain-containing protein [Haloferula chungangensis]|uniref:YdjY domain-containing protein n=1 Tax=Haloferula chungangensis TaxID=1048331 RepID=A0ABW2L3D0_9BACT
MTLRILLPLLLLPVGLLAEEPTSPPKSVEPRSLPAPDQKVAEHQADVTRLDDGRVKIGEILIDPKTREIRFPAEVNMDEGLLEFIVVHENGKIHESLLSTKISATKLNIAIKLLHYKASRELYLKLEEDGSLSSEFETASPEESQGAKMKIGFEWQEEGATKSASVNQWISHAATEQAMPNDPWVYGGSFVVDGTFVAESSGDIIAIFLSNAAMINFAGKDNQNDDVWLPHPNRIPEIGTPVTVVISPFEAKK